MSDTDIYNGMPATHLGQHGWMKPWSGGNGGNCVECQPTVSPPAKSRPTMLCTEITSGAMIAASTP